VALALKSGLPAGLFSNQNIQIWVNFGGTYSGKCWYILWTLGPFYGLLYILWAFGKVSDNLVYFSPFWYFVLRKIWHPCLKCETNRQNVQNNNS
jgi:hypothetical protein